MKQTINAILNGYANILFLNYSLAGIVIGAITLVNPNIGLAGIIAVVAAFLFTHLISMDRQVFNTGIYIYNPMLVGMSIGYIFNLSLPVMLLVAVCGILTFVLTLALAHTFSVYLWLPIVSVPFVLVSTLVYLASIRYGHHLALPALVPSFLPVIVIDVALPAWITGYLTSLGAIFFLPHILIGGIFALCILVSSRILFLLSVAGYTTSVLFTALMTGSLNYALTNIYHFNAILVAMAVGGIFLIPSLRSYTLALIAVCASVVVFDAVTMFWSYANIPGFTLPFNVVLLALIFVLGLVKYPHMARVVKNTPEETLDVYLASQRYDLGSDKTIMLPYVGQWRVWQAFDGAWTHQGLWKHAYDFIITDEHGHSYHNEGADLCDYYAFRKPIVSPVSGRVIKVVNVLPDNPIGEVDRVNNWGNLVIVQDDRGFFVQISHFAQGSIQVAEGTWLNAGTLLGLCGNSGYSPQPHIHIQVQDTALVGAYTTPFCFVSYMSNDGEFHSSGLPAEGECVEPLYADKHVDARTSFILDDVYQYEVFTQGKKVDDLKLNVKMAIDGTFYFDSGRGKLYFGKQSGMLYFYSMEGNDPYLQAMMMALPRMPLALREGMRWSDTLPAGFTLRGFRKAALHLLSSFHHDLARVQVDLTCVQANRIEGSLQSPFMHEPQASVVEWDNHIGFRVFQVGRLELRRVIAATEQQSLAYARQFQPGKA